jgi:DNA polymerase III, gamma/tau subunits
MWDAIVGQEHAVTTLRAAAARPSHAYLLVGTKGSGVLEAARAFACEIIGMTDDRTMSLVARGAHPDVVEFEPTTATYTLANEIRAPRSGETARRDPGLPRVLPEIHRAPVEGIRKVVLLRDADRMEPTVANSLLKSIEEPPPRTVVMLVTDRPEGLLATIRSRCQRVDFAYVSPTRSVATDALRARFSGVIARVDGRAGTTVALVEELEAALDDAGAASEVAAAAELQVLDEQIEARGYQPRTAASLRKRLAERQKQELRRAKTDALIEGISAMEQVYLEVLEDAPGAPTVSAPRASDALDACRAARQADEFNPNVGSLLLRLVSHLPAAA